MSVDFPLAGADAVLVDLVEIEIIAFRNPLKILLGDEELWKLARGANSIANREGLPDSRSLALCRGGGGGIENGGFDEKIALTMNSNSAAPHTYLDNDSVLGRALRDLS